MTPSADRPVRSIERPAASLPTQVFVGDDRPAADRFDPIANDTDGVVKPRGGLWTSSMRPDEPCAWIQWCRANGYGIGDGTRAWWVEPDQSATIVEIDSEADMQALLEIYERSDPTGQSLSDAFAAFDYEALATDYDGLRVTASGQRETRFTQPGLYGIDCESTIWFDWVFESVADGGPVLPDG